MNRARPATTPTVIAGTTDRFAEFVESFAYEQIPEEVISRTKDVIFDGLGSLLSATSSPDRQLYFNDKTERAVTVGG